LWTAAAPAPVRLASDLMGSCVFSSALVPGFDQALQTALPWTLLDAKGLEDFFGCQCSVGNLWMLGTTEVDGQMIQQTIDGFIMLGGKLHQLLYKLAFTQRFQRRVVIDAPDIGLTVHLQRNCNQHTCEVFNRSGRKLAAIDSNGALAFAQLVQPGAHHLILLRAKQPAPAHNHMLLYCGAYR